MGPPPAIGWDPADLLHIDMDQLARMGSFVARITLPVGRSIQANRLRPRRTRILCTVDEGTPVCIEIICGPHRSSAATDTPDPRLCSPSG